MNADSKKKDYMYTYISSCPMGTHKNIDACDVRIERRLFMPHTMKEKFCLDEVVFISIYVFVISQT